MASDPANQESSSQYPSILQLVSAYHYQIMSKRPSVLDAARVFTEEQDIGLDQCNRILTSLDHICKLIQEFSQFLKSSTPFPRILSSNRHYLSIQLHSVEKLTSRDLIPRINAFHTIYWTLPAQLDLQKKEIQRYLESLLNTLNELDNLLKPLLEHRIDTYNSIESAESVAHISTADVQEVTSGLQLVRQTDLTEKIADTISVENKFTRGDSEKENIQSSSQISNSSVHYTQPPSPSSAPSSSHTHKLPTGYLDYSKVDAVRLRKVMIATFKPEELELICSDLGLSYHTLKEGPFENKAQYLIDHFHHRGEYERLVRKVLEERPHLEKELGREVQP